VSGIGKEGAENLASRKSRIRWRSGDARGRTPWTLNSRQPKNPLQL